MEYARALEKARAAYGTGAYDDATLEFLFPQLKESEEEKIIKTLQEYVKNRNWDLNGPSQGKVLAWLEKRKKEIDKRLERVEQLHKEFQELDTEMKSLHRKMYGEEHEEQDECPEYCVRSHCMGCSIYEKQKSEKTFIPEKKNDVMKAIEEVIRVYGKTQGEWIAGYDMDALVVHLRNAFAALEKQKEPDWNKKPCLTCQEYEKGHKQGYTEGCTAGYNKAMKEQKPVEQKVSRAKIHQELLQNGTITMEEYLKLTENPYFQKRQKPAEWSEEDEDMLNSCISSIEEAKENRYAYKETDGDTSYDHEIAWLKSLRPQWRPSEEQMEAYHTILLSNAMYYTKTQEELFVSLYNDLKKL